MYTAFRGGDWNAFMSALYNYISNPTVMASIVAAVVGAEHRWGWLNWLLKFNSLVATMRTHGLIAT